MSDLDRLLAKSPTSRNPRGELLTEHLRATLSAAVVLRDRIGNVAALPERFWTWVLLAALLHDTGKVPDGFQRMLHGGPAWGERHEVLSLGFATLLLAGLPDDDREWVELGVATHHRPLTNPAGWALFPLYDQMSPAEFAARFGPANETAAGELLRWLAATARSSGLPVAEPARLPAAPSAGDLAAAAHDAFEEMRLRWEWFCDESSGRTAVLLQGAVTLADHLSSARGALLASQPADDRLAAVIRDRLDLRDFQQHVAAVRGHLLLRAPTGSGKTEAAQLWAAAQVEDLRTLNGGQPRIFYLLPYLASINAMAGRYRRDLGNGDGVGIAHSRAAAYHLGRSLRAGDAEEDAARKAVSRAAATRLFREPIRIGTPYQLLRGALAGPACSSILIDSANSVFILDELHAYDPRRLGMVLAMLRFWERLGGRIAVLSATLPTPLAELLAETLEDSVHVVEARDQPWPARHRLGLRAAHLTSPSSVSEIIARLRAGQAVLAVANNIADARALYDDLAPVTRELHGDGAAILLHSRFKMTDRTKIEQEILDRFETSRRCGPGLLVATQVVEVSLDVDFDAIHTSGAPLEALLQRFGRVNRLATREPSDVIVHEPEYRQRRGSKALWADGVYEEEPVRLAMNLLARHDRATLDERQAGHWLDTVYASPWGTRWREAVQDAAEEFRDTFLSFTQPFDDRSNLEDGFSAMFDGAEAVLVGDLGEYRAALESAPGAAGRLLGAGYLVPLPWYGGRLGRFDKDLKVMVIDGDYDPETGLKEIYSRGGEFYRTGEIL